MTKETCPKLKKISYAVMVETKVGMCWVTYASGSTIGTEKGNAKLTDSEDADCIALRLFANGIIAYAVKVPDGIYPYNKKDYGINEYKSWINEKK